MTKPSHKDAGWVQPTNEAIAKAGGQLVALVSEQLPQRFYREHRWRVFGAGLIVRMADTVESIIALMHRGLAVDGSVLVRTLYEHVVIYCWVSINRDAHLQAWYGNALFRRLKLHNDALKYGARVLSDHEVAVSKGAVGLKPLIELADEVDKYWGDRLVGFRTAQGDETDILLFRGLYVVIYRKVSQAVHAQPDSLDPYLRAGEYPLRVARPDAEDTLWWPITVPLFTQALVVCHDQLGWPDPDQARAINNAMYEQP